MSESTGDRIHPASPIRRDRARRDGEFPKSFELASSIHVVGALGVAFMLFGGLGGWLRNWTISQWQLAERPLSLNAADAVSQLQSALYSVLVWVVPAIGLMFVLGVLSHWGQTGIVFRPQQVVPDAGRLGPGKWWRHVSSTNSLSLPLIGLPKTLIAGLVAIASSWYQRESIFSLGSLPVEPLVESLFGIVLAVSFHVALALFVISLADFGLKRWSFERRIRMTDQELRDEARLQNGDPAVVSRRRQLHRSYGRPG